MRVAGFDYMDIADTDGLALAVFFSGCCHHCKGCHNPQLQDFSYGEDYDVMDLLDKLITDYNKGDYDYIVFSGGDPLCQDHDYIRYLLRRLTEQGIKVWIYTGYDYDAVPDWCKRYAYCIKCGKYDTRFPKVGKLVTGNQVFYFKDGRREF